MNLQELRRYREARDAAMAELARRIGGRVAVVEWPPIRPTEGEQ
jgi:hypothetical protein